MKVLNLLTTGEIGGIEVLCSDIAKYSTDEKGFCFLFETGALYNEMSQSGQCLYDLPTSGTFIICKLNQ